MMTKQEQNVTSAKEIQRWERPLLAPGKKT